MECLPRQAAVTVRRDCAPLCAAQFGKLRPLVSASLVSAETLARYCFALSGCWDFVAARAAPT